MPRPREQQKFDFVNVAVPWVRGSPSIESYEIGGEPLVERYPWMRYFLG